MTDAPDVQQRQVPQEVIHGSMEFGVHKDGSQDAEVAPNYDDVGKAEDSKTDGLQYVPLGQEG